MAPVRLIERRKAHEPVLAALGLENPVRVLTPDRERRRLQARLLARARLEQLDREPAVRRPALVHAQHHLGPVLRVGAACSRLQCHDGIAGVVLAHEQRRLLQLVELAAKRHERRRDLPLHFTAVHAGELAGIVELLPQAPVALEAARDSRMLGGHLRGPVLVVPEAGAVQFLFERFEAGFERRGVKGTHGPSQAGPRALRAGRSVILRPRACGNRTRERLQPPLHADTEAQLDEPGLVCRDPHQPVRRTRDASARRVPVRRPADADAVGARCVDGDDEALRATARERWRRPGR